MSYESYWDWLPKEIQREIVKWSYYPDEKRRIINASILKEVEPYCSNEEFDSAMDEYICRKYSIDDIEHKIINVKKFTEDFERQREQPVNFSYQDSETPEERAYHEAQARLITSFIVTMCKSESKNRCNYYYNWIWGFRIK